MRALPTLLGLVVWLASMGGAYYFGQQTPSEPSASAPQADSALLAKSPALPSDSRPSAPEAIAESAVEAGALDLDAAMEPNTILSEAATRALLAQAFALPTNDHRRSRMIRDLLAVLAETDPEEALILAAKIGSLREGERAREAILEVWGRQDPQAALNWAAQALVNEPLSSRRKQLLAIYRGYSLTNPEAAFSAALAMPATGRAEQRIQSSALEEIIETQVENGGLDLARQQIEQLEAGPIKERLLREMVDGWASFDPAAAAAYVQTLGDEASTRIKTALVGEWAENDPAAAAAWLSAQAFDEATVGRASAAIIQEWTRYDLAASAEWLNSLPGSPELDRAVASYTQRAAQEDPANAMSWAESINNDWMRTRMMERVARSWKVEDPEGFQTYLDATEWTEEQKASLQNASEGGGMGGGRRWR